MSSRRYVFGPVPSRRLGRSLGISPIPEKTCNYSCVYCQLGRTSHLEWKTQNYFDVETILAEFDEVLKEGVEYDVVSVVGEGEPTLYADLSRLIEGLKARQPKPVCVITNAANIDREEVRTALGKADIVLPSLDGADEAAWKKLHRPSPHVHFSSIVDGLFRFREEYRGEIWLELMLVRGVNDSKEAIDAVSEWIDRLHPDRVYVNTPVRVPSEPWVEVASREAIDYACEKTGGSAIDELTEGSFESAETDPLEAVASICLRHPMNRFEIQHFLRDRGVTEEAAFFEKLAQYPGMERQTYLGIDSWRNRGVPKERKICQD